MKMLTLIALCLAISAGILSVTDWMQPATPFLAALAAVFTVLAAGSLSVRWFYP